MAYIDPSTGQIVRTPITTSTTQQTAAQKMLGSTSTIPPVAVAGSISTEWHKALLWVLGAVLLIALAGPAPNVATMLLLIIIVGVLLGNWQVYSKFLGIANTVTGGSQTTS